MNISQFYPIVPNAPIVILSVAIKTHSVYLCILSHRSSIAFQHDEKDSFQDFQSRSCAQRYGADSILLQPLTNDSSVSPDTLSLTVETSTIDEQKELKNCRPVERWPEPLKPKVQTVEQKQEDGKFIGGQFG